MDDCIPFPDAFPTHCVTELVRLIREDKLLESPRHTWQHAATVAHWAAGTFLPDGQPGPILVVADHPGLVELRAVLDQKLANAEGVVELGGWMEIIQLLRQILALLFNMKIPA